MVKKIYSFALNPSALEKLDDIRRTKKTIPSRSEAVEQLITSQYMQKEEVSQK